MPLYYSLGDVIVHPSYGEPFGLVPLEAMACGKPVIGTNVGGLRDVISDGESGFLVKPKEPYAIAESILNLIRNPERAREMGMTGRRIVENRFDLRDRIERISELYDGLLQA